jgi:Domain of Unknown Function with PDB structure (DUF3857)
MKCHWHSPLPQGELAIHFVDVRAKSTMSTLLPRCQHCVSTILFSLVVLGWTASARSASIDPWDSVSPEDLAAKDSQSLPGADEEILVSLHDFDWADGYTTVHHLVIAKIYTPKGVEDRGRLSFEESPSVSVERLKARVLKPDGRVLELKKQDFLRSTAIKYGGDKWTKISFAFPDLTPGDVVEYQWDAAFSGYYLYNWSYCQEQLPIRDYEFKVSAFPSDYQVSWFNCTGTLKPNGHNGMIFSIHNLPAYRPEEYSPPDREFRSWIMVSSRGQIGHSEEADEAWKNTTVASYDYFHSRTKPGSLKEKVGTLLTGATSDEEKLQRLYNFCQNEIVNYDWAQTPEAKAAKAKAVDRDDQTGPKAISAKIASGNEIAYAFAALASAAGFEVRRARGISRAELLTPKIPHGWSLLDRECVAVKVGDKWQFYDPGDYFAPFGMLEWQDEMVPLLLCDSRKTIFEQTPVAPAIKSPATRKGRFELDDEGTLQGDVEESFAGHSGMEIKREYWNETDKEVRDDLTKKIVARLPTAEVSDIQLENLRNASYPVTIRYKVRVPGYAEQAGSRLTFAPGYFEAGGPVILSAPAREHAIFFKYAHSASDDIEIKLPEGFQLDHPSAPANVGNVSTSIGTTYELQYYPKKRVVHYRRDFVLGANGVIAYQTQAYPPLRKLFDFLHRSDLHALVLRPVETAAPAPVAAPQKSASPDTPQTPAS